MKAERVEADVLVIGGGAAGCAAALEAKATVLATGHTNWLSRRATGTREMAAHASRSREESRGPHFRTEFPYTDNRNWIKQVVVSRERGEVRVRHEPVRLAYLRPKAEKVDYFAEPFA